MNTLRFHRTPKVQPKFVKDIPFGQAFIGNTPDKVYLRTWNGLVDLMYPAQTWGPDSPIDHYEPVNIEFIVKD